MYHEFAESVLPGGKKVETKTIETTTRPEGNTQ